GLGGWRLCDGEIGHVEADPLFLAWVPVDVTAHRLAAGLGEFSRQSLFLRPGLSSWVSGAAIVHEPAIRGPGEAPAEGDPIVALTIGGAIVAERFFLGGSEDARVNPCPTRRRTVVLE